jgi:small subunit ribosomal protein S7
MARRASAALLKRAITPDPLFNNELLAKCINIIMRRGKKACAENVFYQSLDQLVSRKGGKIKDASEKEASEEGKAKVARKKFASIREDQEAREVALSLFQEVLDKIKPLVEVKSRRVGGANYQVPMEVSQERGRALAMRWLIEGANARAEKGMTMKLAGEMCDALEGKGNARKKREETHRIAEANRAFAHFRWGKNKSKEGKE